MKRLNRLSRFLFHIIWNDLHFYQLKTSQIIMFFKNKVLICLQYPIVNFIILLISIQTNSAITNYSHPEILGSSNSWQFLLRKIYSNLVKWFAH